MNDFYNINKTYTRLEFDKVLGMVAAFAISDEAREAVRDITPLKYLSDALTENSKTDSIIDILSKNTSLSLVHEDGIAAVVLRAKKGSTLTMGELLRVKNLLQNGRILRKWYLPTPEKAQYTDMLFSELCEDVYLENDIANAIISESEMSDEASPLLASIRKRIIRQENSIRDKLDSIIKSQNNAKYLQEAIVTMRGGRFVVPVKVENKTAIPGLVHDVSSSGSTLFIEPTAVVEANNTIMQLKADEQMEIERILAAFSARVSSLASRMIRSHKAFVEIDTLLAKARYAINNNANITDINNEGIISIINGRHPLIDKNKVVPISLKLGIDYDALIITGPNTGGKTVTLKTVGLLSLMAACGIPVPADESSNIAIFEDVLVDLGDEQSIEQNLSTFSSHITNISYVLNKANKKSLVLLDELGSGTDPAEGAALAEAVLEKLLDIGCKTIATSHYGEVKMFALETERVENASCDFDIDTLTPTYRLNMGIPGQSNALLICKRLGLEQSIIDSANKKMNASNRRFEAIVERLDRMQRDMEAERNAVSMIRAQAENELEEARKESDRILKESKAENERLKNKSRQLSADIAAQASKLVDELRAMDKDDRENRRNNIARAKQILNHDSIDLVHGEYDTSIFSDLPPAKDVKKGDSVYVPRFSTNVLVVSDPDEEGNIFVQSGSVRVKINIEDARAPINVSKKKVYKSKTTKSSSSSEDDMKKTEVDVRGKTVEEAIGEIEIAFDRAQLSHIHIISIIHGKGTGALRKGLHQWLKRLPYVKSYRLGAYGEGDAGVTVVELK